VSQALRFHDRREAGQVLAKALGAYKGRRDMLVLALPRGGVPVAAEVAAALDAELDLMIVRKLGTPGNSELAMGAVASGGLSVMNPEIVSALRIDGAAINEAVRAETREIDRREHAYRGARPRPAIAGRPVILVDDGVATGATMRVAIAALRTERPASIVVAVPVAPPDTVETLRAEADEVVCLATPEPFMAIGCWYADFPQLTDDEVRGHLARLWKTAPRQGVDGGSA
jgi:putative phosphoribosyl transferase